MRGEGFRIVTYNVHKCRGIDLRTSPARIADVLLEIDPDVIALQEILAHGAERIDNQVSFIAEELGYKVSLGENRMHRGNAYGNALLTRYDIDHSHNFDLTVGRRERRGCLLTDVVTDHNQRIHIYNLHLGTALRERSRQAERLLGEEILRREHFGPRVMLGDFNEWTRGMPSRLLHSHFHSADPSGHLPRRKTFPGFFPLMNLDHIYYDHHLRLEHSFVHNSRLSRVASDHLPVVADFTFK